MHASSVAGRLLPGIRGSWDAHGRSVRTSLGVTPARRSAVAERSRYKHGSPQNKENKQFLERTNKHMRFKRTKCGVFGLQLASFSLSLSILCGQEGALRPLGFPKSSTPPCAQLSLIWPIIPQPQSKLPRLLRRGAMCAAVKQMLVS